MIVPKVLNKRVKAWVRFGEVLWQDIVKITKLDLVIRTPGTILGNIMSNFTLSVQMGMSPWSVLKMQLEGIQALKEYIENQKKLVRYELEMDVAGAGSVKGKKLGMKISRLKDEMKNSSVRELMDEGMYQSVVEDISEHDIESANRITRGIRRKADAIGAPEWVKTGTDWLYLAENNKLFKAMQTATQYSDFVARYALYHHLKNKTERDGSRKHTDAAAMKIVLDAFINYQNPDSKVLQWLNDMGLVMFTKFFLRIQRVVGHLISRHPVELVSSLLGQAMFGDVDDITDQSLITKNYDAIFHNPLEVIIQTATPTGPGFIEALGDKAGL